MKDTGDDNVYAICQKLKEKHIQYRIDNGNLKEEVRKALTDNNFSNINADSPTVSHHSIMFVTLQTQITVRLFLSR